MKKYKRLCVFGGTFSPVHKGHIRAAVLYYDRIKPDIMYVIPTSLPPHKKRKDAASDKNRMDMLSLAFADIAEERNILISDMEIVRGGKSYTSDTLEILSELADEIYVYCGTDMFVTLEEWHEFRKIFELARVVYMRRGEPNEDELLRRAAEKYETEYSARLTALPYAPVEMSSSEIRDMVKNGEDLSHFLPTKVEEYIKENRLYMEGEND